MAAFDGKNGNLKTGFVNGAWEVQVSGTACLSVSATGNLTISGDIALGASKTLTIPATGAINIAAGGQIKAAGTQAATIADAEIAHALNSTFSDTEAEAALDALGAKINSILAALEGVGILAAS